MLPKERLQNKSSEKRYLWKKREKVTIWTRTILKSL